MDGGNVLRYCFDNQGNLDNHKFDQLAAKLNGKITACIRKYYLPGGDRDDLYQWGLLGLYKAVLYYNENDRYTFDFIASRNIQNMIKSAVTMSNRQKNKIVNEAESLNAKPIRMQENNVELIDRLVISNDTHDPQRILIDREFTETLFHYIEYYLSEYERRAVLLYMRGYKQQDIAEELNINTKIVDNAIQRAKKKIYQHVIQQNEGYMIGIN